MKKILMTLGILALAGSAYAKMGLAPAKNNADKKIKTISEGTSVITSEPDTNGDRNFYVTIKGEAAVWMYRKFGKETSVKDEDTGDITRTTEASAWTCTRTAKAPHKISCWQYPSIDDTPAEAEDDSTTTP